MHTRRINSNTIRRINVTRVFHGIRKQQGISPQTLSKETGIDLATISIILGALEQDGLVLRTLQPKTGRSGRPSSQLSINESSGVLAGVAVDTDQIQIILCSYAGTKVAQLSVPGSMDIETAASAIKIGLMKLLKQAGLSLKALSGVGIGMPGLVGLDGHLALAPGLHWHDVDFAGILQKSLDVPVYLENDIKAAAMAESLFGSGVHEPDFIYLSGRLGLGGGLYLGNGVYRGPHGMAGEVGHMKLVPDGRLCACGGRGCFEAYVSERAFLTQVQEAGLNLPDIEAILAAAQQGDAKLVAILADAGHYLGLGMANLVNIFAPSRVILGGAMASLADFLLPYAKPVFKANTLQEIHRDVSITVSCLGDAAVPMGGIAIALQHFLEDPAVGGVKPLAP